MADLTLQDLSERMSGIDFPMLTTRTTGGAMASRPMSNNGDVEYDGDSWFFSYDAARSVSDIAEDSQVGLTMTGKPGLLGRPPLFLAVQGRAEILRDMALFEAHWVPDLERWFEQGVETPGLVLIKVTATRIHYWDGEEEGELVL